ncbi:hypothetical protein AV530_011647 [Patagioenas fasciata monilis]|uniref:Uncharacterized protein n=1 Tax=Patagioenas fasciata monilis TaxID=372326 RepID=A0A1V4J5G3_PATFA|nr:hypothetical protein AV530_011647 [Patagioenas fasciata monilis]
MLFPYPQLHRDISTSETVLASCSEMQTFILTVVSTKRQTDESHNRFASLGNIIHHSKVEAPRSTGNFHEESPNKISCERTEISHLENQIFILKRKLCNVQHREGMHSWKSGEASNLDRRRKNILDKTTSCFPNAKPPLPSTGDLRALHVAKRYLLTRSPSPNYEVLPKALSSSPLVKSDIRSYLFMLLIPLPVDVLTG